LKMYIEKSWLWRYREKNKAKKGYTEKDFLEDAQRK
jgi:hypothetical protein